MLEFREPLLLLLILLAVPLFIWLRRPVGRLKFSSLKLWHGSARSFKARTSFIPAALMAAAYILMCVTIAGPRTPDGVLRQSREGISMMVVIDKSGSMAALDMSKDDRDQDRLDALKDILSEFIRGNGSTLKGRPDDSIGVVSFATFPDSDCPLTLDHITLMSIIKGLHITQDESSTSMGDAIGLATERLREASGKSKVMIVLTDGVNNSGYMDPLDAARMAADFGIKIYTIGIGTNGFARVKVKSLWGGETTQRMPVELDEENLTQIAEMTGGKYFRATNRQGLENIYAQIDTLEKTKINEERRLKYNEHYHLFLEISILLAMLGMLLNGTYYRRSPM